ncbi:MAG: nitroreductase family deazaflavin-dependent oxidoreductase [Anaerolineae bacterium]|nr:nitroreductase family deazaflavin-dependent oxidoreductase [Anaerolineae bacterium]
MAEAHNRPSPVFSFLVKMQNPLMAWLLRSSLHRFVSRMYLLITFTGRKSGRVYTTPVQYAQEQSSLYVVTSAGYTWWKNLRGGAEVTVLLRGKSRAGHAQAVTDLQQVGQMLAKVYPRMAAQQIERFAPGKVAITVELLEE